MHEFATISSNKGGQIVDRVYLGEDILTHILKGYSSPKRIKVFRGRYSKKMLSPTFSKIWLTCFPPNFFANQLYFDTY